MCVVFWRKKKINMGGFFGRLLTSSSSSPRYTVERKIGKDDVEIRDYEEYMVAQAELEDKKFDSGGVAFQHLASYIGVFVTPRNNKKMIIPMTVPVFITSSFAAAERKRGRTMSFVLPHSMMMDPPKPLDSENIKLKIIPERKCAVMRLPSGVDMYNWEKVEEMAKKFMTEQLGFNKDDSREWMLAIYDPPWTPHFWQRNEIHVPLHRQK